MRHLHSLLLIDGQTGEIIWKLGGRKNVFTELPPPEDVTPSRPLLNHVRWQHHAHYVAGTNETQMTIFDNYSKRTSHDCVKDCSRGLHIAIDVAASPPTVQLLGEYLHPARIQSQSQGSVQVIEPVSGPDGSDIGNVFIGWGHCPSFTEHTASGDIVLNVQFSPWHTSEIRDALDNYRAYKMDWKATPHWDPAMAVERSEHGQLSAFVSWNGATEVKEWLVRVANTNTTTSRGTGNVLVRSPRTGFETTMVLDATELRYAWAEALDKDGNMLRASKVVDLQSAGLSNSQETKTESQTSTSALPAPSSNSSSTSSSSTSSSSTASSSSSSSDSKSAEARPILIVLGTGAAAVIVMTGGVGVYVWRRRKGYSRLQGNNIELDTEAEKNTDMAVGEDGGSESESEEAESNSEEAPLRS